jgi:hypothetical protein
MEDRKQQGEVVTLAFTSGLCALKEKKNGLTLVFISETPIPVRENALTGSPGNCCGGKRQQKSVGGIHKSHKRMNDFSKELSPYNYKNICLQRKDNVNFGLKKIQLLKES